MAIKQTAGRDALGEFAPKFAELNDDVLFGQVWSREDKLSLRDRSIVTVVALMAQGLTDSSFQYHLTTAKNNGLTKTEIAEILTHAAFYAGWPKAWAAFRMAKEVWAEDNAADAKAKHQNEMVFPIGAPNDAFAKYFIGQSYLAPLSTQQVGIYNVTFEPGCRNNWHIHHAKSGGGQILVCVAGRGYYQEWGKPAQELRPGDVVNIPTGVKHWHGAAPDINTEDFCAAVDFLSMQENVDPERIGIIGICGWGGMAINAAAIDTRIKATAAMTMYDMTRVTANGYFDSEDSEQARFEKRKALNTQRTEDYRSGTYALAGGVVDPLPEDAPQFVKDYYAYYKTPRGYHPRSLNSNGGWNVTSSLSFLNMPILQYSCEIRSAVLLVHGEKAHSRYFSETAYSKLTGDNKELLIIPGANHTDLYDQMDVIPFEKLKAFFEEYLK